MQTVAHKPNESNHTIIQTTGKKQKQVRFTSLAVSSLGTGSPFSALTWGSSGFACLPVWLPSRAAYSYGRMMALGVSRHLTRSFTDSCESSPSSAVSCGRCCSWSAALSEDLSPGSAWREGFCRHVPHWKCYSRACCLHKSLDMSIQVWGERKKKKECQSTEGWETVWGVSAPRTTVDWPVAWKQKSTTDVHILIYS